MERPKVSANLEEFLRYLRETEEQVRMAEANRVEADAATQDILHALELGQHNAADRARLAQTLREVRRQRRTAKDTLEQAGLVAAWATENHATVKSLERLLGEVRKLERYMENRVYTPKTHILDEKEKGSEG